jgi:protein O-GlcNAc transferase
MRLTLFALAFMAVLTTSAQADPFADGKKAQTDEKFELALESFKKATAQKPLDGEAWYELGWTYNELGKYADAVKALSKAKLYLKDAPKVFYESGYANDFADNIPDAVKDYQKAIELKSNYADAYRQLANIAFDIDKDYDKALKLYNQYVNYSTEADISSKTWYKKGFSEIEFEKWDDAITSLKKSIALDDKYAAAFDEIGYAYYKTGDAELATEAYLTSAKLLGTSSTPYTGLGDVYHYLKEQPDQAMVYYKKAIEINPKSASSQFGVGWCYNDKSEYAAAIPYLKKAVEITDTYTSAYTELGYSYYGLGRYSDALLLLQKSISLTPTASAYYYQGLCFVNLKQKTKALEVQKKLEQLGSDNAAVLLTKINEMK